MSGFKNFTPDTKPGKDMGVKQLAEETSFSNCCVAEYVWVDASGCTRSKTKTVTNKPTGADDCAIWLYNGNGTGQATPDESDVYLVPRAIFDDPFRGQPNVIIMCEAVTPSMEPATGNYRAWAAEIMDANALCDPWLGLEQEYTLLIPDKVGSEVGPLLGANPDGSVPEMTGSYYCGAGAQNVPKGMRDMMDDHYAACLAAGIKIGGVNMECTPGQGEFQIGPCKGIDIADHMMVARHLLLVCSEKYGFAVSFAPKSASGDVDGNGMHCSVSVKQTRAEGGLAVLERVCRGFGRHKKEHLAHYGEGYQTRLDGYHQTCPWDQFCFAIGNRNASIRIPRNIAMTGRGYLEDRRPNANADPYRVAGVVMKTTGEVLNSQF